MLRMALRIGRPAHAADHHAAQHPGAGALLDATASCARVAALGQYRQSRAGFRREFGGALWRQRLGRQELDAELIADNDAAMWQRDWIERGRVREAPQLTRIVVAVDPPASTHGDECGIVVAGRSEDNEAYVLADRSMGGLTPLGWSSRVAETYDEFEADCIVAEANQGGEMVRTLLSTRCRMRG